MSKTSTEHNNWENSIDNILDTYKSHQGRTYTMLKRIITGGSLFALGIASSIYGLRCEMDAKNREFQNAIDENKEKIEYVEKDSYRIARPSIQQKTELEFDVEPE